MRCLPPNGVRVPRSPARALVRRSVPRVGGDAAVAARYGRWAQGLGERCLGGEELAAEGYALRPGAAPAVLEPSSGGARPDRPDRIGGYFLVETETREEAVQLAQSCPHLERGGWIELRPIQVR